MRVCSLCTRLCCSTDPLLHFEAFLHSVLHSGERGNDTFVLLNERRGSSHTHTTGSGSKGGGGCR